MTGFTGSVLQQGELTMIALDGSEKVIHAGEVVEKND